MRDGRGPKGIRKGFSSPGFLGKASESGRRHPQGAQPCSPTAPASTEHHQAGKNVPMHVPEGPKGAMRHCLKVSRQRHSRIVLMQTGNGTCVSSFAQPVCKVVSTLRIVLMQTGNDALHLRFASAGLSGSASRLQGTYCSPTFSDRGFPVAATSVLRKWSFPVRANQQDEDADLPALSPRRWKGTDSSGGGPIRTIRRCSALPTPSPLRWKREVCQGTSSRAHAARFPRLTISGEGTQVCDGAATGKTFDTSEEDGSHSAIVIQLFRCCWWFRWCR